MREKEDYRNNMERLNTIFPNKDMLSVTDVSTFTGFDRKKVRQVFGQDFIVLGKRKCMPKVKLARLIS